MATAQAAVLVAPRQVEMQEFTLPEIGDDDGLLKIEITGVCGADWAPYLGDTKTCSPPVILGHEIVGRIERIGAKAAARWGVKEGDRICMEEYIPCRDCEYCLTGHYNVCGKRWYGHLSANEGPGIWGGYSQYLYLDPKAVVYPMSDKVPVEIAQLFLSMGNGVRWVQSAGGSQHRQCRCHPWSRSRWHGCRSGGQGGRGRLRYRDRLGFRCLALGRCPRFGELTILSTSRKKRTCGKRCARLPAATCATRS